ncbi:hypothetical protein GOV06_01515 [Candidatus Woesearchaeota archaeon]|nr:hypothetical protein [Candidatus Woesearchaeota archaeon]
MADFGIELVLGLVNLMGGIFIIAAIINLVRAFGGIFGGTEADAEKIGRYLGDVTGRAARSAGGTGGRGVRRFAKGVWDGLRKVGGGVSNLADKVARSKRRKLRYLDDAKEFLKDGKRDKALDAIIKGVNLAKRENKSIKEIRDSLVEEIRFLESQELTPEIEADINAINDVIVNLDAWQERVAETTKEQEEMAASPAAITEEKIDEILANVSIDQTPEVLDGLADAQIKLAEDGAELAAEEEKKAKEREEKEEAVEEIEKREPIDKNNIIWVVEKLKELEDGIVGGIRDERDFKEFKGPLKEIRRKAVYTWRDLRTLTRKVRGIGDEDIKKQCREISGISVIIKRVVRKLAKMDYKDFNADETGKMLEKAIEAGEGLLGLFNQLEERVKEEKKEFPGIGE